jgi:hypothetical protein
MRETMKTKELKTNKEGQTIDRFTGKVMTCDVCEREDGAKSDWEGTIEVREWGNEHDCGTICDECQEDMIDNQ